MAEAAGPQAIFAASVALVLGAVTLRLLAFTRVPYSVLLLVGLPAMPCPLQYCAVHSLIT